MEGDSELKAEVALFVKHVEVMIVDVTEDLDTKVYEVNMLDYVEQMKVVYPRVEEQLIHFLNRCKIKDSEVMLFPHYSAVFEKEVTKELEKVGPYNHQPIRLGKHDK